MKKHILFIAAIIIAASGCSKNDYIPTTDNNVKVEFSVADKPAFGAQTKAIKTSWEVGDQIAIALQPESAENVLYETKVLGKNSRLHSCVSLRLEYTESGWIVDSKITPPEGNGKFYAVHHRGTIVMTETSDPSSTFNMTGYDGGELMAFSGNYSADQNGIIKLGTISMALDSRLFQVSVTAIVEGNEDKDSDDFLANLETADGGDPIDRPVETLGLSIYSNWTAGDDPTPLPNCVALKNGSVSVDFSLTNIFQFSSADTFKTGATPVMNYNENTEEYEYSFCFADTALGSKIPNTYTFYINRTPEAESDYTITYDKIYKTFTASESRRISKGKAIRLSSKNWIAVTEQHIQN